MSTNRHNRPRGSAARRVAGTRNRPAADDAPSGANTTEHPDAGSSGSAAEESAAQVGAGGAEAAPEPHSEGRDENSSGGAADGTATDEAATDGTANGGIATGGTATGGAATGNAAAEGDVAAEEGVAAGSGGAGTPGAEAGAAAETSSATGAGSAGSADSSGISGSSGADGAAVGSGGSDGAGRTEETAAGTGRRLGSASAKRRSVRAARRGTAGQHRKPESESEGAGTAEEPARAGRLARVRARPVPVLAVVTVLALAFAGWFGYETYSLRYSGAAANAALTDGAATSEVNGQITSAVEKVLSYDHNNVQASEKAADQLLTGSAVDTYNQLFGVVKEQAPKQQLVVTTSVRESAVTRLEGDQAEVLVFVDQRSMRAETGQSNSAPAQLSIGAHREGDTWKINRITLR
ncbi:hypothetical protein [Bounagaea algeriensis]